MKLARLERLNGWRRLWLVLTIGFALYAVGHAYHEVYKYNPVEYMMRSSAETDFKNPRCGLFMTLSSTSLLEPGVNEPCYHIYLSRKYRKSDNLPYTWEAYVVEHAAERRETFLLIAAFFLASVLFISALTYGLGVITAWVVRGFRTT